MRHPDGPAATGSATSTARPGDTTRREPAIPSLRIVLLTPSYAPRVGGLETAVARLAREYRAAGHRVSVVTNRYPLCLPRFEQIDGVPVYRILFPSLIVPRLEWPQTHMGTFLLLWPLAPLALLRLWLLLRCRRPEVVNVHYLSAPSAYVALLSLLKLLPGRLVVSCHGSDLTTVPYPTGSPWLSRWILSRAQAVTACSADLAHYASMMAPRMPGGNVHIVCNGADADEFNGVQPYAHPRPYIFSAGRLVEKKGMRFLIEALAVLRGRGSDCDLIIAGSGPEEGALRALVDRLGLTGHVQFVGSVNRARLAALFNGCVVFALAPVWEGFGIVYLEAMSCARALVATRTGGIPEVVVDGETGLLARPADPLDLAEKLGALLRDPARAAAMGRRGRARVTAEFSWPAVASRYLASYLPQPVADSRSQPEATSLPHAAQSGVPDQSAARRPAATSATPAETRAPKHDAAVPILMYHQVAPPDANGVGRSLLVTPRAFAAQMRWLHRLGWRTMRLADLVGLLDTTPDVPRRRFVLTFDDAYLGVALHAAPVLMDFGFTATIFVPTQLVGTCHALDGGPEHPTKTLMDWDQLRRLQDSGFDIGAHTRTHPHLSRLDHGAVRAEVSGSRDDIAAALGAPPRLFAYPYGEWTPFVAAAVNDAGFVGACATYFGRVTAGTHRFALPRISVGAELSLPRFAYRLAFADRIASRNAVANRPMPAGIGGRPS